MASSNLLISSSPTPAHQLHHSFRHFEPHPSPLSTAHIYRQNHLNRYAAQEERDDDYINSSLVGSESFIEVDDHEVECEEEEELVEEDSEGDQDEQLDEYHDHASTDSFEEEEDLDTEHDYDHQDHIDQLGETSLVDHEQEHEYEDNDGEAEEPAEQVMIGTFSPSLDASFASSMSIGAAPPSPSADPQRTWLTNNVRPRSFAGQNSILPAHLFAPNPSAMPPSSSPHRMDISPAPATSRLNIPSYSYQASSFQPHSPDDPFGGAPSRENRRALRKPSSRPKLASGAIFLHPSRAQDENLSPRALAPPSDGMDIDSPSYSQPRHDDHLSIFGSPADHYYIPSSPNQMNSLSAKAASKTTLGRKAGERSLSRFRFPATKSHVASHVSSSVGHQTYGTGSLGSASGSGTGPRRPALGVVKSSATLFGCHQSSSANNNLGINRRRDATGRPAAKSRRAISFAATEGDNLNLLLHGGSIPTDPDEEDDEESELDLSSVFKCSPASRSSHHPLVSNTWPKYAESPIRPNRGVNNPRSKFNLNRQVSCTPMGSNSLARPNANSGTIFQSPTRALVATLGSTIESPAGMAFSEKERAGKILPCHKVSNDGLMRISPETMDRLLEGVYDDSISTKIIVDCRFSYEYDGGHIRAAINIHDKKLVDTMLLQGELFEGGKKDVPLPSESGKRDSAGETKKVVVIFHCEYSAMRAPTVAKYLREKDRHMNMPHYPALHYPEVYILEGGYARYHAHSPHHCDGVYVRMDDPSYRSDRHADLNQFRTRESSVFSRAKSFTYGENKKMMKNSGLNKKPSFTLGQTRLESQAQINTFFSAQDSKENNSQYSQIIEEDEEDVGIPESDE